MTQAPVGRPSPALAGLSRVLCGWMLLGAAAQAQGPAQQPLLVREGGGVQPNLMLTLDDSGSMLFQHLPEQTVRVGAFVVTHPVGSQSVRMDPGDNAVLPAVFIGTVAAQRGSSNWRQRLLRSPDTNTLYYNPELRYQPWPLASYPLPAATASSPAGRMAHAPAAAAYRDPMNPVSGGTVNLTAYRTLSASDWCFRGSRSDCSSGTDAYDPGLYYRLRKDASGVYLDPTVAGNYTEYSINRDLLFPRVAARTDCSGSVGATGCSQAEERQNFANWFSYHRTRNLMARGAVAEAFADAGAGLRLGWGRINKSTSSSIDGVGTAVIQAGVRELTPATRSALFGWLQTLPASGGTPLPAALRAVGQYHARTDSRGPWADEPGTGSAGAEKSCRRAYHLLVTDGAWNASTTPVGNADGTDGSLITGPGRSYQYRATRPYQDARSDMLADYAMAYWKRDLRPDLPNQVTPSADDPAFWQHLVQMTIGLGVRGTLDPEADLPALTDGSKSWGGDEIDDLWHAALNSRGRHAVARDGPDLVLALRQALTQVLRPQRFGGGVTTASVALQQGNRRYQPVYRAGDWTGDVQAYGVDASGQGGALVWSAEARLPAPGSRNIATWRGDTRTPAAFTWTEMGSGNQAALGALAAGQGAELVNYLRGDRSREGEGQPFRVRNGRLGDMVNSNPVLVRDAVDLGYHALPAEQGGGPGYSAFLARKAARTPVVYVGANDGMLHGFRDTLGTAPAQDGVEVFAYVPRAVYPHLSLLADRRYGTEALDHRFFVDGALTETDAHVPPPGGGGPAWRNLLLGSLGAGGRAVFAIDVTDPAALGPASVRWELGADTQPDLGHLAAPVQAGVLPNGEWVAIFGNGGFSEAGRAVLFVVQLSTGTAQTLVLDTGGGNGLGGVALARNASGQVTSVYAGDLQGRLWRVDYQPGAASRFAVAGGGPLFQASTATGGVQPITQAPLVADSASGGRLLLVGTGALVTEADAQSTALQSVYGLRDQAGDGLARPLTRAQLAPRSLASVAGTGGITYYQLTGEALNLQTQRGWVVDLEGLAGLRVVHPLQRVGSRLGLVAAVVPARTAAPCETASGQGVTLLLPLESGLSPSEPVFDTNGDGLVTSADARVAGLAVPLGGAPALLKASPVCASGVCATEASLQAPGTAQRIRLVEPAASAGERTVRDRVWRRILNPPIR